MKQILSKPFDESLHSLNTARIKARKIVLRFDMWRDLPIRLSPLCHFIGISVTACESDSFFGALMKFKNKRIVQINSTMDKSLQRFTLAHEIGHCILHPENRMAFFNPRITAISEAEEIMEQEANIFAEEMIMPIKAVRAFGERCNSARQMGEYFGVPRDAMLFRLSRLGFNPAEYLR